MRQREGERGEAYLANLFFGISAKGVRATFGREGGGSQQASREGREGREGEAYLPPVETVPFLWQPLRARSTLELLDERREVVSKQAAEERDGETLTFGNLGKCAQLVCMSS